MVMFISNGCDPVARVLGLSRASYAGDAEGVASVLATACFVTARDPSHCHQQGGSCLPVAPSQTEMVCYAPLR